MWDRYRDWMYERETRLNARDKNRVVRPLEWGLDWTERWPTVNGNRETAPVNPAAYLAHLNQEIVSRSDEFYAYRTPTDFRLEGDFLLFTSPVHTPHAVNSAAMPSALAIRRFAIGLLLPLCGAPIGRTPPCRD